ncbi:MAG: hypothetical protein WBV36_08500 [Terriglobales bacterium]
MKKLKIAPTSADAKRASVNCPTRRPRDGWREAFRAAGASDQKELLLEGIGPNAFDLEEWEW